MREGPPTNMHAMTEARELADRVLLFAAGRTDVLNALFETSGVDAGALREIVSRHEFPFFMLDFLLADDRRVQEFAEAEGIDPTSIARVRARLDAEMSG